MQRVHIEGLITDVSQN